jgi:quinol monooxygenase YgiN
MVTSGLLVRVEAKPDRADDVEAMFKAVVDKVRDEGLAVAWFALRLGPTSFAVVDVFTSDADRDAHLVNGPALEAAGAELFAQAPEFSVATVIATTLDGE